MKYQRCVDRVRNVCSYAGVVTILFAGASRCWGALLEVGPDKPYTSIGAVPWESLNAGDEVRIHWRSAAYNEKWVIARQGTAAAPIVIRGVPGPSGQLPVIDGNGATTRLELNYWSESRGIIKVGGSNIPADVMPRYIVIENLDIRSARPPYTFTDEAGSPDSYPNNAASIFVEKGENITIRNCIIHDSGNGLFVASSDDEVSRNILIEGCHIFDNGNSGSLFEHNTYTAAIGITYQFNRFGPPRAGSSGNNLKDRSAGLVVRCNWIEGGNRQLDLVDAEDSVVIQADPAYARTYVYGNILIEPEGAGNRQIVHYGGDSGATTTYRKGRLHFYHNTVLSTRTAGLTLFRLSTNDEACDARNNIVWVTAAGSTLAMLDSTGMLDITHNLLKPGWIAASSGLTGTLNDDGTTVQTAAVGFIDLAAQNLRPRADSPAIDTATALHAETVPAQDLLEQYWVHRGGADRPIVGAARDIGAFEYQPGDVDGDGGVDLQDFTSWPSCATGPVEAAAPACHPLDFDVNQTVDLVDFAQFQIAIEAE